MKNRSLRYILILQFLVASLVPLVTLFLFSGYFSTRSLEKEAQRHISYLGREVARDVDDYMRGVQNDLVAIAAHIDSLEGRDGVSHDHLDRLVAAYPYFSTISLLDDNFRVTHVGLRASYAKQRNDFLGIDMSHHHGLVGLKGREQGNWSKPHQSLFSGSLEIDFLLPVEQGYLSGMLTLQQLQQLRETLSLEGEDQFALIDADGLLVIHSDVAITTQHQGQRFTQCELVRNGLTSDEGGLIGCRQETDVIEAVFKVPSTGWMVWVGRPTHLALEAVNQLKTVLVPLLMLAMVFALLGAWFTWRRIASPLRQLSELNRVLPEGDYSALQQLEIGSSFREVELLCASQQQMARAIAEREERLLERERASRELVSELYSLFDGLPDSLVWFDSHRRVRWANQAAATNLNLDRGALLGLTCHQLECNMLTDCQGCPVSNAYEQSASAEGLVKTDELIYGVKAFPIHDAGLGQGVVRLMSDVTDKYKLRQETLRNNRLLSLGELSAGIAHEINNPIGLILWHLPLLGNIINDAFAQLEKLPESQQLFLGSLPYSDVCETVPEIVRELEGGAQRIKAIVDELKEFVRFDEELQGVLVDLNQVVRKALRMTRNRVKEATHHLHVAYSEEPLWVFADPLRLEQVFVNLLINACEALESSEDLLKVSTLSDSERDQHYVLVADNGCGIPSDVLERVQDPFFSTKRGEGGTGLGLSISSRIVQQYNGSLKIDSQRGEGTTVRVGFPTAPALENVDE